MTDFPDWQAPQEFANKISITGAPLLVLSKLVDQLVGQNLPHNSSITRPASGRFTVGQPGYEIWVNVATAGGVAPVVSVELQWVDSNTTARIDDELYYFYCGNLNAHFIHGRGPSKADRLVVILTNYHATQDCTISYTVLQTSRIYTREYWHTIGQGAVSPVFPGLTAATMNMSANIIGQASSSIVANGSAAFVLPLYTGTIRLYGNTGDTTAGNSQWVLSDATDQVIAGSTILSAANGESAFAPFGPTSLYLADTALPRSQCTMTMINKNGTTTETLSFIAISQENRA